MAPRQLIPAVPSSFPRLRRGLVRVGVGIATLALAGCGFNVQTAKPYDPAEGVNGDIGTYHTVPAVKLRNLLLLTRTPGQGFLSATLLAADQDALTAVSVTALDAHGIDGNQLKVSFAGPINLSPNPVILTDQAPITVTGSLTPGLTARITMTFTKAGQFTTVAPIIDASQPPYATITPPASASATPAS